EDSNDYTAGASATVLDNTGNLTKAGYTFAGWNTMADGTGTDYAAAATVSVGSADTVLYAKWTASSGGGDNGNSGEVAGVSLDATKYSLPVGGTHTTVLRTNASDNSSAALSSGVAFESSNTAVATVNASTGVVTAVAKGTVTISTYYSNGGTEYRRFATVTVDPKAPSYVEASDKKAGGIYLSVLDPSGAAVKGATVKIASGSKVYPLVTTDDNGRVLKYVPAGTYSVTVYAPNGTTLKNYTTKSLKVVAGQRSEPFAKQQLATGTVSFETNVIASADKTITGTAPTGTVVTARVGAATIGTAKADKTGKFTIKLKTAQPGKTVTVTAVDTEENEKTVAFSVAKAPAVTLTAATKNNDANHDIAITFKDTIGLLPTTVTAVTYNGTPLVKGTAYTIAKGKLTIKKGTFGTPGSYPLVVQSSAYEDASVTQTIVASGKK
ncbi:MAG: InlB B-repeat-containing protein, partial [Paenibacillaceae bacterium]|nr:InlB B-repeat-containing protein [Paenibacillaceae bacterium]